MRKIFFIIGLLIFTGVELMAQNIKPKTNPEMKRFVYQTQSSIHKRTYDSIYFDIDYTKGNQWVFKYTYRAAEIDMIADDEYAETYQFEIAPPKGNQFIIHEADFETNKVMFTRSCFCPDGGIRQLREGHIEGKKVGKNTWLVSFDLVINPREGRAGVATTKQFKGYFKPGKLNY